jgi:hypothetical protein
MHLLPDIAARIDREFQRSDVPAVVAVLAGAVREDGSVADPRLLRCALVASAGSLEKLRYFVELIAIDYRDVIVAGEYDVQNGNLVHVRHLEQSF